MARPRNIDDVTTLQMALVGYNMERERIEQKIREIQSQLRGRGASAGSMSDGSAPRKRELSPAARARIAAAQKRRWAEHRRKAAQAAKAQKTASKAPAKVNAAGS